MISSERMLLRAQIIFSLLTVFFFGLLSRSSLVVAADTSTPSATFVQEKVNPDKGFSYLKKRLGEKVSLLFFSPFPSKKESYLVELTNRRLSELSYVVGRSDMFDFEHATTRYSTQVGNLVSFINRNKNDKNKSQTVEILASHAPVITELMQKFDPTTAEWRFLKQDLDYINLYISQLK